MFYQAKHKAAGDGEMEIEDWESKRDGRDEEAHTAGRGPSPAVGRAVSFDKALGSTPSSVVSGLQKAHPEHESACGRTSALLCFFLPLSPL